MGLKKFGLEDKLSEVEKLIISARKSRGDPGSAGFRRYEVLKAIAEDLRARMDRPRSLSLGELERCIQKVKDSQNPLGYESGPLMNTANTLIHHWSFVRQALENFGEETAE